jgi:hypothetical protein
MRRAAASLAHAKFGDVLEAQNAGCRGKCYAADSHDEQAKEKQFLGYRAGTPVACRGFSAGGSDCSSHLPHHAGQFLQDTQMPAYYSSDDLKSLVRILNDILAEAQRCRPDLSKDKIVERIFSLADSGERDAQKLHQTVFGQ